MTGNPKLAILPRGPHRVGALGPDRFAGAVERPAYQVTFPAPVGISCDPVSEVDYAAFAPAHVVEPTALPVVNVSWHDASAYCAWLSGQTGQPWRLPSEAEWEIACRAGAEAPFATGESLPSEAANFYYDESGTRIGPGRRTVPGTYPPNAWGLHDLHGNVAEWCADAWHPSHEGAAGNGSARTGEAHNSRVVRGGSWDLLPRLLRSSSRDALPPETRRDNLGFRLALTLPD